MRILFITPSGGYTGSEMMLWYLLQQLADRGHQVALFSRQRGGLHRHAGEVPFPTVFYEQSGRFLRGIYEGVYIKVKGQLPVDTALQAFHNEFKPDLWYLNTIAMPETAQLAQQLGVPYVVHFHELISALDEYPAPAVERMLTGASRLIGCADIVCRRVRQMGYANIDLLYSCVDTARIQPGAAPGLRAELGIPDDAFVWLMSGTCSLRKGFDLVPDIMQHLPANTYFLWLGKDRETALTAYVNRRNRQEGLRIVLAGEQSDRYYDYLNLCDGFALTSREDPFPLVMMEAAFLGKPIAAFNSGGVSEFMQPYMGTVVNSFWPADLAAAMRDIMTGRTPVSADVLRSRAAEFDISRLTDEWLQLFEKAPRQRGNLAPIPAN